MKRTLTAIISTSAVLFISIAVSLPASSAPSEPANPNAQDYGFFGEAQPPTQVTARVWRSGRPTRDTLTALYQKGVRVIVNLEDDADAVEAEGTMATLMGFRYYSYPTDSFFAPDDAKMNEIMNIMRTSKDGVLIHCMHGEDRTGLVIGLERVLIEKWPAEKAYAEMLNRGFHELFLGLVLYFDQKTGASF